MVHLVFNASSIFSFISFNTSVRSIVNLPDTVYGYIETYLPAALLATTLPKLFQIACSYLGSN